MAIKLGMNLSSEAKTIQTIFDRIAPQYDRLNDLLSLGQHRVWKHMAVKWSHAQPGQTALDVCCGSGDLACLLARTVGVTGQVVGLDFSCAQLDIARERGRNSVQPLNVEWVEGDALNLPFEGDRFDAITMGYGLRNVTDILTSLRELHRVLKPGCRAAILDFHRPANPQIRAFQQWYLDHLVIPAADRFGLTEEYAYIGPSLDRFPEGREQVSLAKQAGFTNALHYPIAGGMMGILVAIKER